MGISGLFLLVGTELSLVDDFLSDSEVLEIRMGNGIYSFVHFGGVDGGDFGVMG